MSKAKFNLNSFNKTFSYFSYLSTDVKSISRAKSRMKIIEKTGDSSPIYPIFLKTDDISPITIFLPGFDRGAISLALCSSGMLIGR